MAETSAASLHLHLLVHGRVQGVGYRAFLEREALERRLSGWTRNLRSGEVEAVVAGPAETVEALIEACRKGPPGARVDGIVRSEAAPPRPAGPFRILPSAW
jgi:acylphosphatase